MAEDEALPGEPPTGDRTQSERLATADERAAIVASSGREENSGADKPGDVEDSVDEAEQTDMNAVGDDGQVFGG